MRWSRRHPPCYWRRRGTVPSQLESFWHYCFTHPCRWLGDTLISRISAWETQSGTSHSSHALEEWVRSRRRQALQRLLAPGSRERGLCSR